MRRSLGYGYAQADYFPPVFWLLVTRRTIRWCFECSRPFLINWTRELFWSLDRKNLLASHAWRDGYNYAQLVTSTNILYTDTFMSTAGWHLMRPNCPPLSLLHTSLTDSLPKYNRYCGCLSLLRYDNRVTDNLLEIMKLMMPGTVKLIFYRYGNDMLYQLLSSESCLYNFMLRINNSSRWRIWYSQYQVVNFR